uniref:ShKT domain-containing protein n=1 Tax=Lepeophtheirus salmonis TaxID=72036 RepID=A0A0K2TU92_LEPSM
MNSFYLVIIANFFQGINGKITETECVDDSEQVCQRQEGSCYIPSFQFSCPQTCGICKAKCKDYNGDCALEYMQCGFNETLVSECPKTCATCDVCEDLIDTSLCVEGLSDCLNTYMRYACRKTCLYCEDPCNDAGNDSFCKSHVSGGTCTSNAAARRMCKESCRICDPEQC